MFADVHCHLNYFSNYKEMIAHAVEKNVTLMFSNSTNTESFEKNKRIAQEFPENVKALYGLHPEEVLLMKEKEIENAMEWIEENLKGKECAGIGETGLDFKYAETENQKELQKKYFEKHIKLAVENRKAIEVHSRRARNECIELLEKNGAEKVLMHWFYGKEKLLKKVQENGFFVSVNCATVERTETKEFVKKIPLEMLLLESDCFPSMHGKKFSEPCDIAETAEKVAELKEISLQELEKQLEKNIHNLFRI